MEEKDFKIEYSEEIDALRAHMKLCVISLEILYEELMKSKLPKEIIDLILKNYKIKE